MNKKLLLFILILSVGFTLALKISNTSPQVYKPVSDFRWLKTYGSIYYTFDADQWEKNPDRSFDKNGVHLTKKLYHPVNACHYALFCFDEYKATGNERFKKAFLAQCGYLMDTAQYTLVDGDKIGYHYKITFHDLKSPWYSALAQSEAISVMIRYYIMTKDELALDYIRKIKNFMVADMSKGGTKDTSPEGYIWLEEYPNSKQEKQVLNGFFLALVALNEYCKLFPTDKETAELYQQCITSAKKCIQYYDTGTWLRYNRGDKRLVANGYLKWQVNEMQHLWELTGDEFFRKQNMLWATYPYNKEYVTAGCKVGYYNWATPLEKKSETEYALKIENVYKVLATQVAKSESYPTLNKANNLLDGNAATNFVAICNDTVKLTPYVMYRLKDTVETQSIEFVIGGKDTLLNHVVNVMYKTDSAAEWKDVKINSFQFVSGKTYSIVFKPIKFRFIKIEFDITRNTTINISDINILKKVNVAPPIYNFYKTEPYLTTQNVTTFKCNFQDADDFVLYKKSAAAKEVLNQLPFLVDSATTKNQTVFIGAKKYVQVLLVYKLKSSKSILKEVKWE